MDHSAERPAEAKLVGSWQADAAVRLQGYTVSFTLGRIERSGETLRAVAKVNVRLAESLTERSGKQETEVTESTPYPLPHPSRTVAARRRKSG